MRLLPFTRLLCGLLVVLSSSTFAQASSLQERIRMAQPCDTVTVAPGLYQGDIILDKRLTLIGAPDGKEKPILRGTGKSSVVTITADSCTLSGFVIEHCGGMLVNEDAGILVKSNGNRITDNTVRDILFGIYFYHAEGNHTDRNIITGRTWLDVGQRGSGIHIWNSNNNNFSGNVITDTRDGFYIQNASHMLIEQNQVFNVRYGLHYMYADSNTFLWNRFVNNVAGAAIMYSHHIAFRHNEFMHNRGYASYGILFQDCHNSVADSNIIADNVVGLFFEASTDNLFRANVISGNDEALEMFQNSTNNTFTLNNFAENLAPLLLIGKSSGTNWSVGGVGNYWSDYDGYDLDGNGIGDVPAKIQNIFQYLEAKNPNLRLYLYSPASQALAAATKSFPIIQINNEQDDHPLMKPVPLSCLQASSTRGTTETRSRAAMLGWIALPLIGLAGGIVNYFRWKSRSRND